MGRREAIGASVKLTNKLTKPRKDSVLAMKASKLIDLLTKSIPAKRRVLIKGEPGIGKSMIVHQVAQRLNYEVVLFHPAISDPTSFEGLPCAVEHPELGKVAEFLPYGKLRDLVLTKKPTLAFLDDIGQAAPAVQAALMQLVLARHVNGHVISDQVVFVGATNDTMHMAGVSGMIEPLKSRWDTIVNLEISTEDWCMWALANNMPPELMAFIRFRPALLSAFKPTKELKNSPSPRGWQSVGDWLNIGVRDMETFTGAVGEGAATEFWAYLDLYQALPSLDSILLNPTTTEVPQKPGQLYAVATGLARKATVGNIDRVMAYLNRMPKEFEFVCMKDVVKLVKGVDNTAAFTAWVVRNQDFVF